MHRRQEFTPKTKVAAFQRAKGRCERCRVRLSPGKLRYNHRLPCAQGGDGALENCEVLCSACDAAQTYEVDLPAIAKTNRQQRGHIGARAASTRPLPCGRGSKLKMKIGGGTEPRLTLSQKLRQMGLVR